MNCTRKLISVFLAGLLLMNSSIPLRSAATSNDADAEFWESVLENLESGELIQIPSDETLPIPWETEPTEATEPDMSEETIPEETEPQETVPPETEDTEIEYKNYSSVPLYFQNDYPDTMFGSGTVATSGCSITCLAMVATYLTGYEYYPDELAGYFGAYGNNNMERMLYGMKKLRLPYAQCENWHVVIDELKRGKVVILLLDKRSIFTDTQHFVVLTGLTKDGKILINDSNANNYERWDLKEKLITGFPESDLWPGFDGAWSFDKKAMPENPFIYYEEEVYVEPRYVGVTLTMDERELLARMVWVEARGEPFEGQQAVAEVVLNRLVADNFQNSIESIIMAQGQFNSAKFLDEAEPNQTQYEAVEHALKGPYVTPINTVYFGRLPNHNGIQWGWIGRHCFSTQWVPQK